ncbi:hypothetical protein DV515_00007873 [Chloebia gouldiae]|uniref:Uncharacterized protein n=1 Tax=Chloebia gouldiae TaxID=44316 RepID=A0A3L8SG50_CHLGU|nr:hypothetical protein DV515_00007873 [Chloebia gouldiae]
MPGSPRSSLALHTGTVHRREWGPPCSGSQSEEEVVAQGANCKLTSWSWRESKGEQTALLPNRAASWSPHTAGNSAQPCPKPGSELKDRGHAGLLSLCQVPGLSWTSGDAMEEAGHRRASPQQCMAQGAPGKQALGEDETDHGEAAMVVA